MAAVIYGLKTCDTCRKALKSLEGSRLHDIRAEGFPDGLLARAADRFGKDVLNTKSATWRGLDADERARPMLDLIADHPALMKRPLILDGDRLYLGWGSDVRAALGV